MKIPMKRTLANRLMIPAVLVGLVATALPARAAFDTGETLLTIFGRWADKTVAELKLDGAPAPQRTVISAWDGEAYTVHTGFGAVISERDGERRPAMVEVVVGTDELNSSRFSMRGVPSGERGSLNLVVEDVAIPIERDLWIASDGSYKSALAQWQAKSSDRAARNEQRPPDRIPSPSVVDISVTEHEPLDPEALRNLALAGSAALKPWMKHLDIGDVRLHAETGDYLLVTSDGTRIRRPDSYAVIHAFVALTREDGVRLIDRHQWVGRSPADLPPADALAAAVGAMGEKLVARSKAQPVDYYEGPVLFEGRAAADFFRHMVPPEVLGTPPDARAGVSYKQQTRRGPRIGRRLLPKGWTVTDDPGADWDGVAGGYVYDREGTPARAIDLVQDGYVRNLLMTEIPRDDLQGSNGHARGPVQGPWSARMSLWTVDADRNLSAKKVYKLLAKTQKQAGLDKVLVVRRLDRSRPGSLPRPTEAVWRWADGREEPVLLLEFENVDRRVLRAVTAAGGGVLQQEYLGADRPDWTTMPPTGLPQAVRVPRLILVDEMEAVYPGPSEEPRALPRP